MELKKEESSFIDLSTFRQFLFQTVIPIDGILDKDGVPITKILVYWRKKNLVPFIPSGKHTFDVSLSDLLWFRILDILRDFSYPVEKMKLVCDYFFKDAYFDELPKKNFLYHKDALTKKRIAGTLTAEENDTLAFIESSLQDERFLYVLRFQINYLTNLVTSALSDMEDKSILILRDGRVIERHGTDYFIHHTQTTVPEEPYLFISIKHILAEFIEKEELAKLYLPQVLNEKEKDVLQLIQDRRIKEIIIATEGGKVKTIDIKRGEIVSGEDFLEIKTLFGLKNYEHVTVKTIDQKTLYIETKSRIIK